MKEKKQLISRKNHRDSQERPVILLPRICNQFVLLSESASNSPKIELPSRTNLSPAQQRWRKLKSATPDILRQARKMYGDGPKTTTTESSATGSSSSSSSFKASIKSTLAAGRRLAGMGTASSTARALEKKVRKNSLLTHFNYKRSLMAKVPSRGAAAYQLGNTSSRTISEVKQR